MQMAVSLAVESAKNNPLDARNADHVREFTAYLANLHTADMQRTIESWRIAVAAHGDFSPDMTVCGALAEQRMFVLQLKCFVYLM